MRASSSMHTLLTVIAASSIMSAQLPSETISTESEAETATEIVEQAPLLKLGDSIDNFTIATPLSPIESNDESEIQTVDLSTLLADGPVVMTFFRGSWCPYCRTELSDIQDNIEKFSDLGATVIAISPEIDEKSMEMGKELDLGFYIGHDENNELARSLGLTFRLDAKTIKRYKEYGINLPRANGTNKWELPIPATYVIDQDMTVRFVYDDEDYSKRASHKDVLKAVKEIAAED